MICLILHIIEFFVNFGWWFFGSHGSSLADVTPVVQQTAQTLPMLEDFLTQQTMQNIYNEVNNNPAIEKILAATQNVELNEKGKEALKAFLRDQVK